MLFGNPANFAVEIHHEPMAPKWKGFGRMCVWIQGLMIGDPNEVHCSLFHAVKRITEIAVRLSEQWDERFTGHTAEEIFAWIDAILYSGEIAASDTVNKFDFLTNTGEQFDDFKSFIYCTPDGLVCIPFQGRDAIVRTPSCKQSEFRAVASELEQWFKVQIAV